MSRSAPIALGIGCALIGALTFGGCAASGTDQSVPLRPTAGAGGGDAGATDAPSTDGGAPDPGSTGGKGGMPELNTDPNGDAGAPDESCAADVSKAEVVPLDMYIMLDVSGSMLQETAMYDSTGTAITKWTAIKTALTSFISDEASSGMGVGLQYFPVNKPEAPATCTSNADCGDSAPCYLHFCYGSLTYCNAQADCGSAVFNPCVPLGYCTGTEYVCWDDLDCPTGAPCAPATSSFCAHTAKCDAASYAEPAEPIAPLPDAAPALLASLEAQVIIGNSQTPTGPALSGAIKQASVWAKAHPNHRVVAVLATDGLPNECSPTAVADVGGIATTGLSGAPSINTFAIGVFTADGLAQGKTTLDTIAKDGGTQAAFVIDTSHDVASQFRDALDAIRGTQLACEFKIPEPRSTDVIDYSLINVNFKTGKKSSTLLYVGSADACDPLQGGWYYDTDPAVDDPTRIIVCPTTCTTFQGATNASVDIAVGCQTIVK
jgi:hypothetical protein